MTNRYLTAAFAPVNEEVTALDLAVVGEIPPSIDGLYVRNGPNPIGSTDGASYHWFLGDGMLHGIELSSGKARSYKNRWVRMPGSVANTNVVAHGGKLLALVEVSLPTEVGTDLSTRGRHDYEGRLRSSMTAHPHVDPTTGEMCFFGYEVVGAPFLRYHVAASNGELVHSEEITIPGPSMMHDFAITKTRAVFLDLPVVFDLNLLGKRPFPAAWTPEHGARVGVMPRRGTDADMVWCELEPCYVFHVLNAYDEGDDVVVDVCRYETMFADDLHGVGGGPARLERWTVSPSGRKVRTEVVADLPLEFPRPDERLVGQEHRYGYFASPKMKDGSFASTDATSLVKVDLRTGSVDVHDFGEDAIAGEGVFVPASEEAAEDEGYVLTIVASRAGDRPSDLVILDAGALSGPPLATVHLPVRVPLGFHGNFVPSGSVA